jgi:4-carboxymuconolactone decarboxylase
MKLSSIVGQVSALCVVPMLAHSQPSSPSKVETFRACHVASLPASASGPDRLPEIPIEKLTEAQKRALDEFRAGRGVPIFGPFVALLRSPEVLRGDRGLADYLRFKTVLPAKLREFAILITAREWTQEYEWDVHCPIAVESGLSSEITASVAEGRRPITMSAQEEAVYEFCIELHRNRSVSDMTYDRALKNFGEQGVVDLVALNGFYTLQAMVLNVARTPLPSGSKPALNPFPN